MPYLNSKNKSSAAWFSVLLTATFLFRLWIALLPVESSFRLSVPDDAYYDFTIAHNLAAGLGATSDQLAPTNGFHPLWVLVIVPFWFLAQAPSTLPIHLALAANALFSTLAALVLYALARRLISNEWLALLAPIIYVLNPFGLVLGVDGLETSLAVFLFGASLLQSWKIQVDPGSKPSRWFASGLLWGMLLVARTDFIFIVIGIILQAFWQHRHGLRETGVRFAAWLGGASAPVAPWAVWNLLTFGTIIQVSSEAYPFYQHTVWLAQNGVDLGALWTHEAALLADFAINFSRWLGLGRWMLLPAMLLGGAAVWRLWSGQRRTIMTRLAVPTLMAGLTLLYHALYRWQVQPWYTAPFAFLAALWLMIALAAAFSQLGRRAFAFGLIALAGLYLNAAIDLGRNGGIYPFQIEDVHRDFCGGLARIGESDSGFSMYFAPCLVVNLDGVVNNQVFQAIKQRNFRIYLEQVRLEHIAVNPIVTRIIELGEGAVGKTPPWR